MSGASRPAVSLRGISRRFGWTWALRRVDLAVNRGVTLALVGPNGAGKTTLLKVLATLLRPTEGEGEVLGFPLRGGGDEIRARTGLLTGFGYLYGDLTAAENLRFAARMAGGSPDARSADAVLERVGLGGVADRRVRAFSTGMRKRLALAQLLLRPLDLVLLDEPYAGLDSEGVCLVDEMVREFRDGGATVVIASHQEGEAMRTAECRVALAQGKIVDQERGGEAAGHHRTAGPPATSGGAGA
ncbi:MAG: ABC transporter ATP-binding protein [Gemmatimonadota bacterium]